MNQKPKVSLELKELSKEELDRLINQIIRYHAESLALLAKH